MTYLPEENGDEETGEERVDAVLNGLTRLGEVPVSAHVGVFEEVFAGLEGVLASADDTADRQR
ncbi:hypothetical protein [Streptosporangium sandarakinum]|uniref:Uncharacterized protein n=1 Tax=Streptosporangium sandarakinum TaxID=1260955 RepID=A0A852VCZ5_9ACTN|nr:hypothetical protein [Streptosporangium sandarakinum]NYF44035.1 hypothetical protein [Streptosporangium sandarakinum]